jgi:hypothetical protein
MLNNEQVKVFKELLNSADFKGKNQLAHLLWRNTTEPKFKVGDFVIVTDYNHRIYGYQVINFKAKVVEVKSYITQNEYCYGCEIVCKFNDKETKAMVYQMESDLKSRCLAYGTPCDNVNELGDTKSKYAESCDL